MYADSTWEDKLTAVNITPITYNEIGNSLTYGTYSGVRHEYSVSGGPINRELIYSFNGQYIAKDLRYYYDTETGLYYLQSRYYNPQWGRFINVDSQINTGSIISYNMFAYWANNPVMLNDFDGHIPFFAITAAIGAVAVAIAIVGGVIAYKNGWRNLIFIGFFD